MAEEFTTYGTQDELKKYIVHYPDVPEQELAPGANSHLVAGKQAVVSFLTMPKGTYFPVHQHEAEQIMVLVDGFVEQIIDGKLYPVNKGDVIVLPSNVPHGGYVREDSTVIDIFAPAREDLAEKAAAARAQMDGRTVE